MKRIVTAAVLLASIGLPAQGFRQNRGAIWDHLKKSYDKDGDGQITKAEYPRGEKTFARLDRNQDGILDKADFQPGGRGRPRQAGARRGARAAGGRNAGGRGAARSGRRNSSNRMARMFAPELAKIADRNHDGNVPPKEWRAFLATLDADEDGFFESSKLPFLKSGGMMSGMVRRALDLDHDGDLGIKDLDLAFAALDQNGDKILQRAEIGELPIPGEKAPDFTLPYAAAPHEDQADAAGDQKTVTLSSFAGHKPVALIFGSYT